MEVFSTALSPLLKFAKKDKDRLGLEHNSKHGREYGRLVVDLMTDVPNTSGFYIWGNYQPNGLWRTIYLGKAGYGKTTGLKARLTEELKDERLCIWCRKQEDHDAIKDTWLRGATHPAGIRHAVRSLKKLGSTHIFAVTVPTDEIDNKSITAIESDLIETMNPIANMMRPGPSSSLQDVTIEIIRHFKNAIHLNRP